MQQVMSHALRFGKYRAQRDIGPLKIEAMILDELLAIPADATTATVQGIDLQIVSAEQADKMLNADANDEKIHECILQNGRFLFETDNSELKSLYKVQE